MPTNADLRKFVQTEGWQDKDKAAGRRTGDHRRYTFVLQDGDELYTRISHGAGGVDDPGLFARILRDQLRVTEQQFWACVNNGTLPPRPPAPTPTAPENALDAKLARNLLQKVGLTPAQLGGLSKDEAVKIWKDHLAREYSPDE